MGWLSLRMSDPVPPGIPSFCLLPALAEHHLVHTRWNFRPVFNAKENCSDFPDGPVVKTLCFQSRQSGFDPWLGN